MGAEPRPGGSIVRLTGVRREALPGAASTGAWRWSSDRDRERRLEWRPSLQTLGDRGKSVPSLSHARSGRTVGREALRPSHADAGAGVVAGSTAGGPLSRDHPVRPPDRGRPVVLRRPDL